MPRDNWRCHKCGMWNCGTGKDYCWNCGTLRDGSQKFFDAYLNQNPPKAFIPKGKEKNIKEVMSTGIETVGSIFKSKSGKGVVIRVYGPTGAPSDTYYFVSTASVADLLSGEKPYINLNGDKDYAPKV